MSIENKIANAGHNDGLTLRKDQKWKLRPYVLTRGQKRLLKAQDKSARKKAERLAFDDDT